MEDCLVCRSICSCIPDSHPHRITSTKCRIDTVISPDDGDIAARNMYIKEIKNKLRKLLRSSWLYSQDYTGTLGQQNTKFGTLPYSYNVTNINSKFRHEYAIIREQA